MAGSGKKWLLGCGLGCGIPLLLIVVLTIGGSVVMMRPFKRAVTTQKELTAAYGKRNEFVPPADFLAPERLAKFIAVRRSLMPLCRDFVEIGAKFRRMDEIEEGEGEPSKGEVFGAVGQVMGAAFGIAGNIGKFTRTRNEALLAQGMGLGEYIWLYTLVYDSWLGHPAVVDLNTGAASGLADDDRELMRTLVRAHAGALRAAGRDSAAAAWAAEADRLQGDVDSGIPWSAAGLPVATSEALAPFRADLDSLYCPATSSFEFAEVHRKGLAIVAD